jgi:septal ring factor EnvC (AmiA/AmiB activator)
MDELRRGCLKQQASLQQQLKAFKAGMRTYKDHVDTTQQEMERVRAELAELDDLLAQTVEGNGC